MVYCPECGQNNVPNAKFCRHCGASLAEATVPAPESVAPPAPPQDLPPVCKECGTPGAPGEKFCGNCGALLKVEPPSLPETPAPPAPEPVAPTPPPEPKTRPCPSCGADMPAAMKFCGECGASMTLKPAPAPTPPVQTPVPPPAAPQQVPSPAPVYPPGTRPCRTCGNPVKSGEKYCNKCCAIVTEQPAAGPASPPVPVTTPKPAPIPESSPVLMTTIPPAPLATAPGSTPQTTVLLCTTCKNPVSDTEKFCGSCGAPVVRSPPAPAPAPNLAGRFCGSCGAHVRDTAKFCNSCGATIGASPAQQGLAPAPGAAAIPAPGAGTASFVTPVPPGTILGASSAEQVLGVIGNAKKTKMFGASFDTYSIVITNRRMIFAQLTQALANAAIMEAQAKARAEGKGFFGIVQDQLAASFGFAKRYETLSPDQTLAETPGNTAIENSRITAIRMQLKNGGSQGYNEFKTVIESLDGKFEYIIAEDERFTNLLRTAYGDRLQMPPGYFSKAGVRIKFF